MAETSERSGTGAGQQEQSATEQAKEKVQETAQQVQQKAQETAQQVQQKAQDVKGQASDRVRHELDSRSTEAGSQLHSAADAMRRTGKQLREEDKEGPAKVVDMVAERAERLGDYMTRVDADKMLDDVEDFARRQPWLAAIGGATLGFFASRFMKASSSRRYEGGGGQRNGQRSPYPGVSGSSYGTEQPPYASPALGAGMPRTNAGELPSSPDRPLVPGVTPAPTSTTATAAAGTEKGGRPRKSGEPRGN